MPPTPTTTKRWRWPRRPRTGSTSPIGSTTDVLPPVTMPAWRFMHTARGGHPAARVALCLSRGDVSTGGGSALPGVSDCHTRSAWHGRLGDPLPDQYPLRQRVEDLRAVIEALNCGPVIGVGLSAAGTYMVRLAWAYPALLKKLVLLGVRAGPQEQLGANIPPLPDKRSRQQAAIVRGDFSEVEDFLTDFAYQMFSEPDGA